MSSAEVWAATAMAESREAAPSSGRFRGALLRSPQVRSARPRYGGAGRKASTPVNEVVQLLRDVGFCRSLAGAKPTSRPVTENDVNAPFRPIRLRQLTRCKTIREPAPSTLSGLARAQISSRVGSEGGRQAAPARPRQAPEVAFCNKVAHP